MTLQEETLQKGKSVHPTPQNTELHCRLQQLFLHIKMLSSGNLEAVKLGGGRKKNPKSHLVHFGVHFHCHERFTATAPSAHRSRGCLQGRAPRLQKLIPTNKTDSIPIPFSTVTAHCQGLDKNLCFKIGEVGFRLQESESACLLIEKGCKLNNIL